MNLIARSTGPKTTNGIPIKYLTIGKSYRLLWYSFHDGRRWSAEISVDENESIYIPRKPKFYVAVITDLGKRNTFWNDYFLSTPEMRKLKMRKLYGH